MKKRELVLRELLFSNMEKGGNRFTQLALSKKLGVSLGSVNYALKDLRGMGAVHVRRFYLELLDAKKALLYWASVRRLDKDVVFKTRVEMPVSEIEKTLPSGTFFTAYTAYKLRFNDVPSDYGEVYAYATPEGLAEARKRFAQKAGPPNLVLLKADPLIGATLVKGCVCAPQMFADLWNLKEWYAKEFLDSLEKRLFK